jgi:hypothetical protein
MVAERFIAAGFCHDSAFFLAVWIPEGGQPQKI